MPLPGTKMALKFVNKSKTKLKNFLREVSITNSLSSSPFIIKVFDVVFETEDCYVFAQEYAPAGDLFDIIPPQVRGRRLRAGSEVVRGRAAHLPHECALSHCGEGRGLTVNETKVPSLGGGHRHLAVSQ